MAFHGFDNWVISGVIDEEFITDYQFLVMKIYRRRRMTSPMEDFQGFCIEKVLDRLKNFDPNKGKIGTFLYNVINNEASRILYDNYKCDSLDQKLEAGSDYDSAEFTSGVVDHSISYSLEKFCKRAWNLGLKVDMPALFREYHDCVAGVENNITNRITISPITQCFIWWRSQGEPEVDARRGV